MLIKTLILGAIILGTVVDSAVEVALIGAGASIFNTWLTNRALKQVKLLRREARERDKEIAHLRTMASERRVMTRNENEIVVVPEGDRASS